jgi:hypothetical protein
MWGVDRSALTNVPNSRQLSAPNECPVVPPKQFDVGGEEVVLKILYLRLLFLYDLPAVLHSHAQPYFTAMQSYYTDFHMMMRTP